MLTLKDRAEFYNRAFPKFSKQAWLQASERWLWGVWMIGNNYRSKMGYYGEYPPGYLDRVMSLFPDMEERDILHLFSGSLKESVRGLRLDVNPELSPNITGNAEKLSSLVNKKFRLIIADPPYSEEDAKRYGKCLVNRNKVVQECKKVLSPGGFLVWLDQVFPMYRKAELNLVGTIGIIRSTNHRVRMVFIWQRIGGNQDADES